MHRCITRGGLTVACVLVALCAPAVASGDELFGFSTSANRNDLDNEIPHQDFARLGKQGGANVLRIDVSWKAVQRDGPQDSRWGQYDAAIAAMLERDIEPLIMIANAPEWAEHPSCTGVHCPPAAERLPDWALFAQKVAERYPRAVAIEIWNSPNTFAWWPLSTTGPDAAHYSRVYSWAANSIHRKDPSIPVLFGAIGWATGNPNAETSIPNYMRTFYRNVDPRALAPADGFSIHPYPSLAELDAFDGRFAETIRQARSIRNEKDPGRKLWVTETGMTTTGSFRVTEKQQAEVLLRVAKHLEAQNDVAATIIYTLVESRWNEGAPYEKGFGVVAREGAELTPKLAFCAFAQRALTPVTETGCAPYPSDPGDPPDPPDPGDPPDPETCTVRGTSSDDTLVGTSGLDVICGKGGNDRIVSDGGNDIVLGGRGKDRLKGGLGADLLRGGIGRDRIRGQDGNDVLFGGRGRDRLVGGQGTDRLDGGGGRDREVY